MSQVSVAPEPGPMQSLLMTFVPLLADIRVVSLCLGRRADLAPIFLTGLRVLDADDRRLQHYLINDAEMPILREASIVQILLCVRIALPAIRIACDSKISGNLRDVGLRGFHLE